MRNGDYSDTHFASSRNTTRPTNYVITNKVKIIPSRPTFPEYCIERNSRPIILTEIQNSVIYLLVIENKPFTSSISYTYCAYQECQMQADDGAGKSHLYASNRIFFEGRKTNQDDTRSPLRNEKKQTGPVPCFDQAHLICFLPSTNRGENMYIKNANTGNIHCHTRYTTETKRTPSTTSEQKTLISNNYRQIVTERRAGIHTYIYIYIACNTARAKR